VARSTRRDDRPGPESEGGRVVLALILGLALLAGGVYLAAYVAAGDKVPVGTTIAGVDIGGKDPTTAMDVLRDGLAGRADTPFTVSVNGHTQQVPPGDVGLGVDYSASVRNAGAARSWRLSRLWAYYTSGTSFRPVVTLDQRQLASLLQQLDLTAGQHPRDGSVVFGHQTFTVRQPRPGLVLDPRSAGTAFWNAYLTDDPTVQLQMSPIPPTIDAAAINRFVRRFANPAMASAVELHFGDSVVRLPPSVYGDLLGARRVGHHLEPTVRAAALARLAEHQLSDAELDRPKPATVALSNGQPRVVPARPGVRYTPHDVGAALMRAITSRDRRAQVHPTPAKASFTAADARALGIRRQLGWFTVRLPRGGDDGALASAVQRLDGTVLKPHQSLSLRGLLGRGTPETASGDALATALFNSAWLGGLQVTAHATSPSYTGHTPVGRDASMRDGHDVAFTDNTPYGVLVSVVAGRSTPSHHGSLTVTLWSTPQWKITSTHGDRTDVVAAGREVRHGEHCTARDGRDGFRVTVTRSFAQGSAVDHTSSYTASYVPVDAVGCKASRHHARRH
jgi:vancomycin resistance protein YoaR